MDNYLCMTLEERLLAAGLVEQFHQAVITLDEERILSILRQVGLSDGNSDKQIQQAIIAAASSHVA